MLLFTAMLAVIAAWAGVKLSDHAARMREWQRSALQSELWRQERVRARASYARHHVPSEADVRMLPVTEARIEVLRQQIKALD
jgi:hypothetical protein